jgi:hypothetical protein
MWGRLCVELSVYLPGRAEEKREILRSVLAIIWPIFGISPFLVMSAHLLLQVSDVSMKETRRTASCLYTVVTLALLTERDSTIIYLPTANSETIHSTDF